MLANRAPRRLSRTAVIASLSLSLSACADQLYIASTTVVGLDASVNTARTSGRVQLGYDRYFVSWLPRTVDHEGNAKEAMSALNCTHVVVGNLSLRRFEESLATGVAATNFARSLDASNTKQFFSCFSTDQ